MEWVVSWPGGVRPDAVCRSERCESAWQVCMARSGLVWFVCAARFGLACLRGWAWQELGRQGRSVGYGLAGYVHRSGGFFICCGDAIIGIQKITNIIHALLQTGRTDLSPIIVGMPTANGD